MDILFSRHAKKQMKWRKVTEIEVKSVIDHPDTVVDTIKKRKNAFKLTGGRNLKTTYKPEDESDHHNSDGKRRIIYENRIRQRD